jgi:hypothetical protein
MIFTPDTYFVIQDLNDKNRELIVISEADNRKELENIKGNGCEIYKEQGEELYRLICERRTLKIVSEP